MSDAPIPLRSFLFVPGDSQKKLAKAAAAGADALILDLEDAVAAPRKPVARDLAAEFIAAPPAGTASELWVRINPISEGGLIDLAAVVRAGPHGIMLPKAEGHDDVVRLSHYLDILETREGISRKIRILPVSTETARAPFGLASYARPVSERLYGLTWGAEDLSSALGASTNRDSTGEFAFTYRMVRSMCLLAARAAAVEPVETLYANFRDLDGLRQSCIAASAEGFTGRIAIHPDQVGAINAAFMPSTGEVETARRIVAAFASAPDAGAVGLDGKMLDRPHQVQAERVLARSAAFAARATTGT